MVKKTMNYLERLMQFSFPHLTLKSQENYFVSRKEELERFLDRIERGRYAVIFAPRQTGKTTFFKQAINALEQKPSYIPIQLDFQIYVNASAERFYQHFQRVFSDSLIKRLRGIPIYNLAEIESALKSDIVTDDISMWDWLQKLPSLLPGKKVAMVIDEFDGIPQDALKGFLHTLRMSYTTGPKVLHSIAIVGVKSVAQLNYDRSVSPFNIQDDFVLPNFTLEQVRELLTQYTDEVGQPFDDDVIELVREKTAGQPFLVNYIARMLTDEMEIPKAENITNEHFRIAYKELFTRDNTHFQHIRHNVRRKEEYKNILLGILYDDRGIRFNIQRDELSELVTYGLIKKDAEDKCVIDNPVYQQVILDIFAPIINGVEDKYLPYDTMFSDYLSPDGHIQMSSLLENFCAFVKRAGYRILEVPSIPKEFVGQYLLMSYLDMFVLEIKGFIYPEVPTGRGRMDIIILHNGRKYVIETKLWRGEKIFMEEKKQLAKYLDKEGVDEGYYVIFDHRIRDAEEKKGRDVVEGKTIYSFQIPIANF